MNKNFLLIIIAFGIIMSCKNTLNVGDIYDTSEKSNIIEIKGIVSSLVKDKDSFIGFFLQDNRLNNFTGQYFSSSEKVEVGDKIKLKILKSYDNNSDLFFEIIDLKKISKNHSVGYKKVSFPLSENDLKLLVGKYVEIQNEMIISDAYNYLKYGLLEVSTEKMIQSTEKFDAQIEKNQIISFDRKQKTNSITLDDFSDFENPETLYLDPAKIQIGGKILSIRGLITEYKEKIRLRVSEDLSVEKLTKYSFGDYDSGIKIMSFNVQNLFNGDGLGGGFPTKRGAKNLIQYQKQLIKLKNTIGIAKPDIVALMEIENDGFDSLSTLHQFCEFISKNSSKNYLISPNIESPGKDQIKTALIYDSTVVKVKKSGIYYPSSLFSRSPLFQEFSFEDSLKFIVSVNHFKSKSTRGAKNLNLDQKDGQASFNYKRIQQSKKLNSIIDSLYQNIPLIVLGDFNSYTKEDPIQEITLNLNRLKTNSYSYVYKGRFGNLDHVFVNNQILPFIKSIETLDINTSSPNWMDYKSNRWGNSYLRSSDHNPLIIYLY